MSLCPRIFLTEEGLKKPGETVPEFNSKRISLGECRWLQLYVRARLKNFAAGSAFVAAFSAQLLAALFSQELKLKVGTHSAV